MVVGTFPIAKLGVLLVKQISKPIANVLKDRAKTNHFFRTYVCMPPAYFYNWCEVKCKMWVLNIGKGKVNIPVLSETMAIELGANLLGEGIIFALGAGLLVFEYNRQSNKEFAKENARKEEMEYLTSTIRDIFFVVQTQQAQVRELQRSVDELQSRGIWKGRSKKEDPSNESQLSGSNGIITPELKEKISKLGTITAKESEKVRTILPASPTPVTVPEDKHDIITQSLNHVQYKVFRFKPEVIDKPEQSLNNEKKMGLINDALFIIQRDLKGLL